MTPEEKYLKEKVWEAIIEKKRETATELIAEQIQKVNSIYTTRNDEKSEVWIYQEGIYVPQGKTYIKEFSRKILEVAYTPHLVNQIIAKVEADTYVDSKWFFNHNYINEICLENGILNLETKELTEFDEDKIFFNKLPVSYKPKQTCPQIQKFFEDVLPSEEDQKTIYELFGFCLWKDYFIEQAVMMLGQGRNGKSKTLEILKRFLGVENVSGIKLQEFDNDKFKSAELFGKLANLGGDVSNKDLDQTVEFKSLTGRDPVNGSRKFLSDITFVSYAKQIFATNHLPKTRDFSNAFWERWVFLIFPYTFEPQEVLDKLKNELSEEDFKKYKLRDNDIVQKITTQEELNGLLNLALSGLDRLRKNKKFTSSQSAEEIKKMWVRESDSFHAFCLEHIEQESDYCIIKRSLKKRYTKYCKRHKIIPESDKSILFTLTRFFGVIDDRRMINGELEYIWDGIAFKDGIDSIDLRGGISEPN